MPAAKPSKLDVRIDGLRKILKDLRDDPQLSHEQLESVGLPTLDQLTAAYQQRMTQSAATRAKIARAAAAARQFLATLRALADLWTVDPPLDLGDYIAQAEKQLAEYSTPEEEEIRQVAKTNAALEHKLERNVVVGMKAVNTMRAMCGLRPLVYDLKLCTAAWEHSNEMQVKNYFSHESPVPSKKTPSDRAKLAGTTSWGENIFKGFGRFPGSHQGMVPQPGPPQGYFLGG